ncbi:hypothetical protein [Dictyobacter alpinus]|nr:hypothetical protein [Dictyobacter alpinus]
MMADYFCPPFWPMDTVSGPIEPEALPLQQETVHLLYAWADRYDRILNMENPIASSFETPEAELAWRRDGIHLWKKVKQELAPHYEVYYFDDMSGKLCDSPEQLEENLDLKN